MTNKNIILHKAETRRNTNYGWLHSKHTFSFANYHKPERINSGVLRVLNDDGAEAGMGLRTLGASKRKKCHTSL